METDHTLVIAAQDGDAASFNLLAAAYRDMVYSLALSYLNDFDAAYDISQEVFLRAWIKVKTLEQPDRFRAWLRTLTVNACRTQLRRQKSTVDIDVLDRTPDASNTPMPETADTA